MKKLLIIFISITLVFGLAGCKNLNKGNNLNNGTQNEKQVESTLYFPNKAYISSGDESLPRVLPEKRIVTVKDENLPKIIVEELLKGPKDANLEKLSSKLKLNNVTVRDQTAYVDFKSEGLSGSSLEEGLILDSVVMSLTEGSNIKQVQFLLDGKISETLMGHIDISKPISR